MGICLRLVSNSHHRQNLFAADNRDHHLANDRRVTSGQAFFIWQGFVIVMDDRSPLTDRISPHSGLLHSPMLPLADRDVEETECVCGPDLQAWGTLIRFNDMEKGDCAIGQITDLISRHLHNLFQRMLSCKFHQLETLLHNGLRPFAFSYILGDHCNAARGGVGSNFKITILVIDTQKSFKCSWLLIDKHACIDLLDPLLFR